MAAPIECKAMVAFGVNDLREVEIVVRSPMNQHNQGGPCKSHMNAQKPTLCALPWLCYPIPAFPDDLGVGYLHRTQRSSI